MEERYIASVDLGSSKVAVTVAKISGDDVQVLYYNEKPSDGVRNSAVFNPAKAAVAIKESIREAEEDLKIKILQVVVGLPRCDVRQEVNKASVVRTNPDESITVEEIEALKSMAKDDYPIEDPDREKLYGAVAQSFSTDEEFQIIESDIVGVISEKLEGNFKLFIGKKSSVRNIDKVFNSLGIAIASKYFTPGTLAKAVLLDEEMDAGVALIDFGAGATSVSIYTGRIMRYYASIPFGAKVITSDIKTECTISEHLAENIKLAWGACQPERLASLDEKIIQIEEEELGFKQIPVKYLSEIITARTKEIIEAILYYIQKSGLADNLRSGIVVTGGGAELANLGNFIKELSGYSVRIGSPRPLFSCSGCPGAKNTSAANSIGMILAAKEDGTINCIDAPEEEIEDVEIPPVIVEGDSPEESATRPIEEVVEIFAQGDSDGASLPEDAEEGDEGGLFSDEDTLDTTKPARKPRRKKEREPRKTRRSFFENIEWEWGKNLVKKIYSEMGDEEDAQ